MELLRIISMLMVLAVHIDGASLGLPDFANPRTLLTSRNIWQTAVESVAIIGVNCFTLISGYFGIKFRWKSIASFLFQCLFYAIFTASIARASGWISWSEWWERWLVLTHTDLWYVPAYFCLMILAPFVNAGFERMTRKECAILTSIFLLFTVWCGWLWGGKFNPTGYTVLQLILVYMIGRVVRSYDREFKGGWIWILAYLVSVIAIFLTALNLPAIKSYAYNSPAVLIATFSFFMIFKGLRFKSSTVNYIALSSFAVYLLHKSPDIWVNVMRPAVVACWRNSSLLMFSIYAIMGMVSIYVVAMLIDTFRRTLWRKFERLL